MLYSVHNISMKVTEQPRSKTQHTAATYSKIIKYTKYGEIIELGHLGNLIRLSLEWLKRSFAACGPDKRTRSPACAICNIPQVWSPMCPGVLQHCSNMRRRRLGMRGRRRRRVGAQPLLLKFAGVLIHGLRFGSSKHTPSCVIKGLSYLFRLIENWLYVLYTYICMYVCVRVFVCTYIRMYVCIYIHII